MKMDLDHLLKHKKDMSSWEEDITVTITGTPKPLLFFLSNMKNHLLDKGVVRIEFNVDGTQFEATKRSGLSE